MQIAYHRKVQLSRKIIDAPSINNEQTMELLKYLLGESRYRKIKPLQHKYDGEALRLVLIIRRLHINNLLHGK